MSTNDVSKVEEHDFEFAALLTEHLSKDDTEMDEADMTMPFLNGIRAAVVRKEQFHLAQVKKLGLTRQVVDDLIAVALDMVGHDKQQEVEEVIEDQPRVGEEKAPRKVDLSEVRCGNATAADIAGYQKYRHALWPIAAKNDGIIDLAEATDLILAVMKPHGTHNGMKSNLGKFLRTDPRWERISKGQYRLLEVNASEGGESPISTVTRFSEGGPTREAA